MKGYEKEKVPLATRAGPRRRSPGPGASVEVLFRDGSSGPVRGVFLLGIGCYRAHRRRAWQTMCGRVRLLGR